MTIARSAAEALSEHTTLELECIDRMYLNVYVQMARVAWRFLGRWPEIPPLRANRFWLPTEGRYIHVAFRVARTLTP